MLTIPNKHLLRQRFRRGVKRLKHAKGFTRGNITIHKSDHISIAGKR